MAELGILREEGVNVRRALPLTIGDWTFGEKWFGSPGRIRTYNPSVNSQEGHDRTDDTE